MVSIRTGCQSFCGELNDSVAIIVCDVQIQMLLEIIFDFGRTPGPSCKSFDVIPELGYAPVCGQNGIKDFFLKIGVLHQPALFFVLIRWKSLVRILGIVIFFVHSNGHC